MSFNPDVAFYEIPPSVASATKKVAELISAYEHDPTDSWIARFDEGAAAAGALCYKPLFDRNYLVWQRLHWLDAREYHLSLWHTSSEQDIREYSIPVVEAFHQAARSYPEISVDPEVMAGAPCVKGTRIPVYMILDAIEYQGSVQGALQSYPRLGLDQVKAAIGFAKLVVECPIEHEDTVTT